MTSTPSGTSSGVPPRTAMVPAAVLLWVMEEAAALVSVTTGMLAPAMPRAASVSTSITAKNLSTVPSRPACRGSASRQAASAPRIL